MGLAVKVEKERCKGCQYCIKACPKDAVSLSGERNSQGIEYISVDLDKCVGCGTCYTVCPDLVFTIS
ncbi:4Fe-4S dicluster domain-containing protein [Lactonifactor sp. BIOML-A3]|nr:4Fe-4S dicluster domain-containing protein [Lactonifactor sp. BIOML-A5]MSA09829.1 4Fe-4S dicluster domain-containing protein [Lactonifactor sp. BIOML-A4]MSA14467.1 4Fe-4S dicluster domain-containing protein [Lactonifactor sp. BIOML-A3]MSA18870.1 4Fe-4S dicluster domain-containing protein [Lactonifactor sp. BIOML-A2]MSA39655.1 4Fe-4S dicluster domain-containing protein [Lactonifactor sp. BIOML-A1]MSB15439.1 4Fe-4S dicluster domain-containing protein [Lactonifactor sp. BIOML-A6]MSB70990.1 4F